VHVLTHRETRDGRQILYATSPFPQRSTEGLKRMPRSTLIPSSTSLVTRSHLGRLIYSRCLLKAQRRGELRGGRIMKMPKTSQKVCPNYCAYIEVAISYPRRYGTRHLGSRPTQLTVSQCHNEPIAGCSASRASSSLLPPPSWLGYNRTFLQTPFKGTVCPILSDV
jgi:hypothetical protein